MTIAIIIWGVSGWAVALWQTVAHIEERSRRRHAELLASESREIVIEWRRRWQGPLAPVEIREGGSCPRGCVLTPFSSRCCPLGTRGCELGHGPEDGR